MRRLAVCLLAFSLGFSAQAQPVSPSSAARKPAAAKPATSRPAAAPASGPCIGVFPLLGDRFAVKKIGLTVFGNEDKEIAVENWGLDDLAVERVRAAVGPGKVVRRIAAAKGAFDGYTPGIGMFQNMDEKAAAIVQRAASPSQCERYVVVTRAVNQYVGNQSIFGVGIVNSGRPIRSLTQLHAVVRIHVHDGRSFAVLKSGTGSLNGYNILTGRGVTRELDDSWWPEEAPEAANTPAMRKAARELLAEILDKSLPELLAP
jgi:hypothetical protein